MTASRRLLDVAIGVVLGGVAGAIVAVNLVIFAGIGYDVTISEVFRRNGLLGVLVVAILIGGPIAGIVSMRRYRRLH
jgi:hypothetical protein